MCLDVTGLAANLYRRNTCIIKVCDVLLPSDRCCTTRCLLEACRGFGSMHAGALPKHNTAVCHRPSVSVNLSCLAPHHALLLSPQVPTTLMAVVDAAVGIKTAVNFHEKKNKLGTYHPPLGVLYDTSFMHTLESRHISNGSAEVLKMACIKDAALFGLLEAHGSDMIATQFQVCERCGTSFFFQTQRLLCTRVVVTRLAPGQEAACRVCDSSL